MKLMLVFFLSTTSPASAFAQGPPAAVRVDTVREELVTEERTVTGSLRAARRVAVATREKGLVVSLRVSEGDKLLAGQMICQLDSTQLELDLAIHQAQLLPAKALVGERTTEVEQARRDLRALEVLTERKAANPKELEDAQTRVAGALARLDSARAQVAVKWAEIKKLEQRIQDMRVLAPFEGTVVSKTAEEGAWLAEGATVVEIVSANKLEVWLDVPQSLFSALAKHSGPIRYKLGNSEQDHVLKEYVVIPDVSARGRMFALRGPATGGVEFASGMSILAHVPTSKVSKQITIHRDAILRNEAGAFVYVVVPASGEGPANAAPVSVQTLYETNDRTVIRTGSLQAGTQIVIEGNERLYPMAPIQPSESTPNPAPKSAKERNQ
ncbi:MAG: membrane fusion protein (multidrug efflux system) [Candidatus Paceibacteria bacterium]|jgi:membrane fusion protein (multidrug efflux system)